MRALGFPVKKQQVVKLAGEVDPNHGGTVNFDTYLEISELCFAWMLEGLSLQGRRNSSHTNTHDPDTHRSEGPVRVAGPRGGGPQGVCALRRGRHGQGRYTLLCTRLGAVDVCASRSTHPISRAPVYLNTDHAQEPEARGARAGRDGRVGGGAAGHDRRVRQVRALPSRLPRFVIGFRTRTYLPNNYKHVPHPHNTTQGRGRRHLPLRLRPHHAGRRCAGGLVVSGAIGSWSGCGMYSGFVLRRPTEWMAERREETRQSTKHEEQRTRHRQRRKTTQLEGRHYVGSIPFRVLLFSLVRV